MKTVKKRLNPFRETIAKSRVMNEKKNSLHLVGFEGLADNSWVIRESYSQASIRKAANVELIAKLIAENRELDQYMRECLCRLIHKYIPKTELTNAVMLLGAGGEYGDFHRD